MRVDNVEVLLIHIKHDVPAIEQHVDPWRLRMDMPEAAAETSRSVPFVFEVDVGDVGESEDWFFRFRRRRRERKSGGYQQAFDEGSALHAEDFGENRAKKQKAAPLAGIRRWLKVKKVE